MQGATSNSTTTLVESVKNGDETLAYTYDELGNITSISKNGTLIESYTYDALNQLKTVTRGTDTYTYNYDDGGNILSVTKNGTATKTYTYGDTEWRDLLTAYNGQTITYDNIGNPLTYYNGSTFTWSDGRKLTGVTKGSNTISYTYDSNGLRTSKTVNGTTTEYYWLDGTLYAEKTGNRYIYFHYDDNGIAYGFTVVNGSTSTDYYYIHNLQGDVIGIVDNDGTKVVEYTYNEWGKILTITGSLATTIGTLNPFRYRGYYYDAETGFYYVSSRYYDPEIGRWINADGFVSTGQGLLSNNMYSYCLNNPINYGDVLGMSCICLTQRVNSRHKCNSTTAPLPTLSKDKESPPSKKIEMIYNGELSDDNKVLIATIAAEATVTANKKNVSWQGRQAMANVAINRVGSREWSMYDSISEICQFTGFDGYGNKDYRACMNYLNNRDGLNSLYEEIIWDTMAAYRNDITNGCQLYYTPAAMPPQVVFRVAGILIY
ncbi:MAG: hypothetical protein IKU48_05995 [Clostridia bacterium]|nr:hypothetical protein [Clostridia bacterium]